MTTLGRIVKSGRVAMPSWPSDRRAWVDRLRLAVIIGVIAVHAATAYVVGIGWYVEQRTARPLSVIVFSVPAYAGLIFGLAPLFFVSGWLSGESMRRHGPGAFLGRRLLRLGVPLVVYVGVLGPVAAWLGARVGGAGVAGAGTDPAGPDGSTTLGAFVLAPLSRRDVGPMWFVAALLVFSAGYAAWRGLRAAPSRNGTSPSGTSPSGTFSLGALWLGVGAIAVADFLTWLHWSYLTPGPWSVNLAHWPQSGLAFALGVIAGEHGWLLPKLPPRVVVTARRGLIGGWLVLLALAAITLARGGDYESLAAGWHWQAAVFALCDGLITVSLCLWLTAAFQARLDAPLTGWRVAATRGSYAAYVLHPLVLVALSVLLVGLPWPAELKFVLVAGLGIPLSLSLGYLVTRIRGVRRIV